MDLEELRTVRSEERRKDSLQHLQSGFYEEVADYLRSRKAERDRRAEQVEEPFSDDEVRRLSDEIKTAEEVAEAVYERRVGKVVKLASFAAADMPVDEEGLTDRERDLFEDLVARIDRNKSRVLDILAGDADADDATVSATSAGADANANAEVADATPDDGESASEGVDGGVLADAMGGGDASGDADAEADDDGGGDGTVGGRGSDADAGADANTDAVPDDSDPEPAVEGDAEDAPGEYAPRGDRIDGSDADAPPASGGGGADETASAAAATADSDDAAGGASGEAASGAGAEARADADAGTATPSRADAGADAVDRDADAGGDSTSAADDGSVGRTTVRITRDVGSIFGVDEREYDLAEQDVVSLPDANAGPLIERGAAERLGSEPE